MEAFVTIWRDDRSSQFEFTHSEASLPCFKPWLCPLLGSSHTQGNCQNLIAVHKTLMIIANAECQILLSTSSHATDLHVSCPGKELQKNQLPCPVPLNPNSSLPRLLGQHPLCALKFPTQNTVRKAISPTSPPWEDEAEDFVNPLPFLWETHLLSGGLHGDRRYSELRTKQPFFIRHSIDLKLHQELQRSLNQKQCF